MWLYIGFTALQIQHLRLFLRSIYHVFLEIKMNNLFPHMREKKPAFHLKERTICLV